MKKLIFVILLIIPFQLSAPPNRCLVIAKEEGINPYLKIWEAVKVIESGNNNYAINFKEGAYGAGQIRKIKLDWYFQRTGIKHELRDCFDAEVSKSIFMYHMMQYDDENKAIMRWNGKGIKAEKYLKRVKAQL
jgi:hypothetical protein